MSIDLVYSASSTPASDDQSTARLALLLINLLGDISMESSSVEFRALNDVVRNVLTQSNESSIIVKDELVKLRFSMQGNGN